MSLHFPTASVFFVQILTHFSYALITDNALFCNYLQENDFCGLVLSTHIKNTLISLLSQEARFVSNAVQRPQDCRDEDSSIPEHYWYLGVELLAQGGSIPSNCCLTQPLQFRKHFRVWEGLPQLGKVEVHGWRSGMEEPSRHDELTHLWCLPWESVCICPLCSCLYAESQHYINKMSS